MDASVRKVMFVPPRKLIPTSWYPENSPSCPLFTVAPARLSHTIGDVTQLRECLPTIHQSPRITQIRHGNPRTCNCSNQRGELEGSELKVISCYSSSSRAAWATQGRLSYKTLHSLRTHTYRPRARFKMTGPPLRATILEQQGNGSPSANH